MRFRLMGHEHSVMLDEVYSICREQRINVLIRLGMQRTSCGTVTPQRKKY